MALELVPTLGGTFGSDIPPKAIPGSRDIASSSNNIPDQDASAGQVSGNEP